MFGFIPEPYKSLDELTEDQELDEVPDHLSWASGNVGVACDGRNAIDRTFVKGMTFGPQNGIASVSDGAGRLSAHLSVAAVRSSGVATEELYLL